MIITMPIDLAQLILLGSSFPWPTLDCPRCHRPRMWGHGYVGRIFEGVRLTVFVKRYRCPGCGSIVTMRPEGYWPRYQSAISAIYETLLYRVRHFTWPPWTTRQRAGHWLRKLLTKAKSDLLMKASVSATVLFFQEKNLAIF